MSVKSDKKERFVITLLKCVGLSYIITLVFFIIFSILLTYTKLSENIIPIVNSGVIILSIALGSITIAFKVGKRGWFNGAMIGVLYIFIMIVISYLFVESFEIDTYLLFKVIISIITGLIGGMIGINLK